MRSFLLAIFLFVLSSNLLAQDTTQIQLVRSDYMTYAQTVGEVQRLIGNVVFKHEDTDLRCDSAWKYMDDNLIRAYGNVYININDSVEIYGDTLYYYGDARIAELHGNVVLKDSEVTLNCKQLTYERNRDLAFYDKKGEIQSDNNTLTSELGYYHAADKEFFFKDNVHLINEKYVMDSDTLMFNTVTEIAYFFGPSTIVSDDNKIYCENGWYDTQSDFSRFSKNAQLSNDNQLLEGDSLVYDRDLGLGKAYNNVMIKDSARNALIYSHYAELREHIGEAFAIDSAVFVVVENQDSLFLHADTLMLFFDDSTHQGKLLQSYQKVKFYRTDLQGMTNLLEYDFEDSTIRMFESPILWSGESQLTSDIVNIFLNNGFVDSMMLDNNAFIIQEDYINQYNQVKGRDIIAYFSDSSLNKAFVNKDAESIYFVRDEYDLLVGVDKGTAENLLMIFKNNKTSRVTKINDPKGSMYPIDKLIDNQRYLDGFEWHIDKRPLTKNDIFTWEE